MSFLSRRPSRPGSRDSDAGRDDEYGDYDYAPDGYGGDEDESWSPGQYFSPEGIKARWAGGRSGDRTDARGRRGDAGQGDARGNAGQGYEGGSQGYADSPGDGYSGYGAGGDYGYGADEYATGAYDLPEGSDEEPAERTSRRRKDRGDKDRGERTGVFRLRRDRGEDIWPDDGISDEDYWASVASDRPLTGANPPLEADPVAADSRPTGRPGGQASSNDGGARMPAPGDDVRAGAGPRLGADSRTGGDQRFSDEQRGVTGRLGPPPGLRGDYQPGGTASAGRTGTGPQAARPGSGPMAARPGTGPQARPGVGSAGAWSSQAGYTQSGTGQAAYRSSGPQASYQPNGLTGRPPDSREPDSRQADRGADWGERTERIERVNAAGYPEPRGNSRGQGPGRPGPSRTSGPLGAPVAVGRGSAENARGSAESARSSAESARGDGGWGTADSADRWAADQRASDRRVPDYRAAGRDGDRDNVRTSGGWPAAARGGAPGERAGDDDPLTSRAYSRAAVTDDADGRSYRVAARRSQAQVKLTEQPTATFTAAASYPSEGYRGGQYDTGATEAYPAGQYPTGVTGEYPAAQRPAAAANGHRAGQYQTGEYGAYPPDAQASAARYRGYGSQPGQSAPSSSPAGLGQPSPSSQPSRRGQPGPAGPGGQASAGGPAGLGRTASPGGSHGPSGFGRPSGSSGAGASSRSSGPQPVGNSGRVSLPTGSAPHSGSYPAQGAPSAQPRQPQQRPQSPPSRHGAASPLPAGSNGSPVGGGPLGGQRPFGVGEPRPGRTRRA